MITYDFVCTALQARLKLKISGPIRLMRSRNLQAKAS